MFQLKPFQREGYARLALTDGAILADEPGLGKTIGGLTFALLKVGFDASFPIIPKAPVLVVAPGGLHVQWSRELQERFGARFTLMDSIDTYRHLCVEQAERRRGEREKGSGGDGTPAPFLPCSPAPLLPLPAGWYLCSYEQLTRNGVAQGHLPLATHVATAFACVIVDEGVRLKSTDSKTAIGLRQMNPPFRLVLTGTPVKNLISDLFWLAWWTAGGTGEPNARFPYPGTSEGHREFCGAFMVSARNLSKRSNRVQLTPHLSSLHMMWKLCAPLVLRRRKADIGEQLVAKRIHIVHVPMGTQQARVYRHHLRGEYLDIHGRKAAGAQLQALRLAACAPHSLLLQPARQPYAPK